MATVVLQTLGAAVGGAVGGPLGAMVGRAAGALAGSAIDQKLLSKDQVIEGPRLDNASVLASTDGAPIPKVYGRNKISGQIIWATRFEERVSTSGGGGGKGSPSTPSTRTYSYSVNFAVGICEGAISGIRRIWADGEELDLTKINYRIYKGSEDQLPDPLIEAKQGAGNTPAYRGLAYVVFEGFELEAYGNRVPQMTFEVIRQIGKLEQMVKSITVIPGSTEYGYDVLPIATGGGAYPLVAHNTHSNLGKTDWVASIDELQMTCPNLESVTLVLAWFGTDLRASHCQIKPGVTTASGPQWNVAGVSRLYGHVVSQVNGRGAYGGTPSDASVLRAIADLKARGFKVVIYPFIMMDIASDNQLPWLDGNSVQPAYPWRGEITCISGDQTASARAQINSFVGGISHYGYYKFIMHYANLAKTAGGVDGFLIGAEMRGMTKIRDENDAFPFVDALMSLAANSKSLLGNNCFVSYAADWSEYFGYHPQDGSGDVFYHLDPLWASPNIDVIGIDNYMPLSDWRDAGDPADKQVLSPYDLEYLQSNILGGEGYDWYYASSNDRKAGIRTPITDGLEEPWTFRYKDLQSWWSNAHYNRVAGVKKLTSTPWQPQSKPFYFTELGCAAIDKGSNQPNVFYDPKSDQSAIPYFSSSERDDLIQRRFLQAHLEFWSQPKNNPLSTKYSGRMVDVSKIAPWAWDARPFPWFPLDEETWSDGENWHTGHWLNGRLGNCAVDDLIAAILFDYDEVDFTLEMDGMLDGYVIPAQSSLRAALEPLIKLFDINVFELDGRVHFQEQSYADRTVIEVDNMVQEEDEPKRIISREANLELPSEVMINHRTMFNLYEPMGTKSRRIEGGSDRQISINLPAVMSENNALKLANKQLRSAWMGRETCKVTLPTSHLTVTIGDAVSFSDMPDQKWLVEGMDTGVMQELSLRTIYDFPAVSSGQGKQKVTFQSKIVFGQPQVLLMDLPLIRSSQVTKHQSHMVVTAQPWAGGYGAYISPSTEGYVYKERVSQRGVVGTLLQPLSAGPLGRWDCANEVSVSLPIGSFQSSEQLGVLNGANMALVQSDNGHYEILQFMNAVLQQDGTWKLSKLLRGQIGTEPEMLAEAQAGANIILFDDAVVPIELEAAQIGLEHNWLVGPASDVISAETYAKSKHTNNARSRRMLRPVHLKAIKYQDGIHVTWIRQGRIDADSWEGADIPLDAGQEIYQIHILDAQDNLKRELITQTSAFIYENAQQVYDLGSNSSDFVIEVAQLGDTGLAGDVVRHTHTA